MTTYAALWVKSNYSFLEGASHPEELVERAHALGIPAMAITDRHGVYGLVRAYTRARELSFHLICGAEIDLELPKPAQHLNALHAHQTPSNDTKIDSKQAATTREKRASNSKHPNTTLSKTTTIQLVLLCQNTSGYRNLCQLVSQSHLHNHKDPITSIEFMAKYADGLIALSPVAAGLKALQPIFGDRLYALVSRHLSAEALPQEAELRQWASKLGIPTVAGNEVLYHCASRKPLQDILTCIRAGKTVFNAGRLLRQNAEHDLKPSQVMQARFADDMESLARTLDIAARCHFSLSDIRYRYPAGTLPDGTSESERLRELTLKGARQRFPDGMTTRIRDQIDRELSLIETLEYGGYFLTMWEIVQFCKSHHILCQGRGSAANSIVCYCLGITAVDPIKLDLLFERFLSIERAEPPDIDLDIEHERREEVIQWVYNIRYDRRHAAMVANVIRYRTRSAMRDVGKALSLPATCLDRLSKTLAGHLSDLSYEALQLSGLDPEVPINNLFLRLVDEILDFPRHLSIHPGGFLLGDEPVDSLVPIEPAAMKNRTIIQWDKYSVEDLGLFKVDLLGLGALSHIRRCFALLSAHCGVHLDMASVPHDDPKTYAMISRGDTIGVFQIESRAQMSMLPRLRPQSFYDLVIEVALVRPGPIQGDMVHPYLKRRNGEESPEYPHPALRQVLEKTLGVPIFQEQVMKIAVLVGGYSPGEADQLRRDMAAWKSSGRIERHRTRLLQRMVQHGLSLEYAERIFSQIRGFSEYGFPESHAASFALIAYTTAYLRCHYPAAFTCSLLNAQPMGFYSIATLVEDAKHHQIAVRPIDISHSVWDCTLEPDDSHDGHAIRIGLRYIKGFGTHEKEAFEAQPPPYRDLDDLVLRTRLPLPSYLALAKAGALDSLVPARRDAIWQVRETVTRAKDRMNLPSDHTKVPLFSALTQDQEIRCDYQQSQHSTRGHPLLSLRPRLIKMGVSTSLELKALPHGSKARYVGMAICRQRPGTASGVTFYTLEDETGLVNLVVWNRVFERYPELAKTALLLGVTGHIQSESNVVHLVAEKLWDPQQTFDIKTKTRNFH